ncbi:MAG: hypothetical protein WBH13_06295 [Parasynechococcus sp.]
MQKGFKILNLRSAMPLGLMAAGLITGFAVTGLVVTGRPGRADQEALSPVVQRRVATVILAQRIRAFAAMAQAHSLCLVRQGTLSSSQAGQALNITLQDLGIDPGVLENPLVEKVSPRFQGLLGADCSLDPKHEQAAQTLLRDEL